MTHFPLPTSGLLESVLQHLNKEDQFVIKTLMMDAAVATVAELVGLRPGFSSVHLAALEKRLESDEERASLGRRVLEHLREFSFFVDEGPPEVLGALIQVLKSRGLALEVEVERVRA